MNYRGVDTREKSVDIVGVTFFFFFLIQFYSLVNVLRGIRRYNMIWTTKKNRGMRVMSDEVEDVPAVDN